jgi:hypothetical protein
MRARITSESRERCLAWTLLESALEDDDGEEEGRPPHKAYELGRPAGRTAFVVRGGPTTMRAADKQW